MLSLIGGNIIERGNVRKKNTGVIFLVEITAVVNE